MALRGLGAMSHLPPQRTQYRTPEKCSGESEKKAGKADTAARPNACLSTNKLMRAWLLAPSRTVRPPTSSTKIRHERTSALGHLILASVALWLHLRAVFSCNICNNFTLRI